MWIYDENHAPYLVAYALGSTLAISAGVWVFLRSQRAWAGGLALLAGFYGSAIISAISWLTWDWKSYYGLPKTSDAWYDNMGVSFILVSLWASFLLWPVLIEMLQKRPAGTRQVG